MLDEKRGRDVHARLFFCRKADPLYNSVAPEDALCLILMQLTQSDTVAGVCDLPTPHIILLPMFQQALS